MKKNKFIKSTLILIIGGFVTKILSMVIKVVTTRLIGTEGIGLYMLINPTFILFISLCTFGMPTAISKLVSEEKSSKKIMLSATFITIIIDIILMLVIILSSKFIAYNLLHEPRVQKAIIAISFVLPFISISSILRGYFFGKQKMLPHVISNIIEDIIRMLSIILFIPLYISKGIESAVYFLVISNIISELSSIMTLLLFIPKQFKIYSSDVIYVKDIMHISVPTTFARLIGCIGLFLEPIILTYFLYKAGNTSDFIINEYGILNGYVLPVILLPSFFTNAISQALLPDVSNYYSKNDNEMVLKRIKQAIFFSLLIGIPCTIIFTVIPQLPLQLLYDTTSGINYLRFLAPICLMHYIQSPLTSALQGLKLSKEAMYGTLGGIIVKTILLIILCLCNFKIWSLVIADSINIFYVTIHHILVIKKRLN